VDILCIYGTRRRIADVGRPARTEEAWEKIEELGERMRQARLRARLTQAEMAQRLGVTQPTVSNWEQGKNLADDVLRITADWARETKCSLENLRSRCLSGLPSPPLPHQLSLPEPATLVIADSA
jgi:DNA-binding XRE family transcriptional regulator